MSIKNERKESKISQLTHGNAIDFQLISLVVITIEGAFADSQGTANSRRILHIFSGCGEVFVDAIHHRNDGADIRGTA
jgi:hypothetical protein